ncbi:DUF2563 family protein [Speluncibacter jeojiensis]|uniref:DUF2563 family protein n=1 Tax=Speluncibacter jeojiensis TaxID=2710754 RepID=A0A9X4M8X1_9ACTN|nr:DUF2563 family protein [Corynebacteriales bacterium D3-21]
MYVDSHRIRLGANRSHETSERLEDAARLLTGPSLPVGSFGGFPAARTAHARLAGAHHRHVGHARTQRDRIVSVADRAVATADGFDAAEEHNHALLRRSLLRR